MDPARYQSAVALFEEALDLPVADRSRWMASLDEGDPELALLVRRMLQADDADWEPPAVAEQLALDMLDDRLEPGAWVGGFLLKERLGAGGMAAVWRAAQERPQRQVALKILHAWQRDPLVLDRFRFEADALARLRHPAFPEVYAVGEEDGRPWIAMELVEGVTLNRWLADALPGPEVRLRALIDLVEAVAGLHALDIVHRDLTPANVLIGRDGGPRVVDLGVAAAGDDEEHIRHMAVGTPGWSSPEQREGAEAGPTSDVYALGVIGRLLLLGARGAQVPSGVPADVLPILDRATADAATERYPQAAAMADELRRARDGLPVAAVGGGSLYRVQRWAGRHRRVLRAAAVVVGMLGVAAATTAIDRWLDRRAVLQTARDGLAAAVAAGERQAGDPKAAFAELRSFLQLPEAEPVAWEGWLLAARSAAAAHELDGELEALGLAWSASVNPAQEAAVLERSVDALMRRWSFRPALAAARHAGDTLPTEARVRLRLLSGDLPGALDLLPADDPRTPLVRALSRATRAACPPGLQATTAGPDGRLFAVDAAREELLEVARTPALTPLRRWPTGDLHMEWPRMHLVDLGEVHLLATREGQPARLEGLRLDPEGLTPVGAWPETRVQRVEVMNTQLGPQILLGTGPYARHLVQIDPVTWRSTQPAPEADVLQSDIMDVEAVQLDDDPDDEVLLGLGPWWAYGALRLDRTPDGSLKRTASATLGFVHDLTVLRTPRGPRVVALQSDRYPAPELFGDERPFGLQPAGIHLLRPDDLAPESHLALPAPLGQEDMVGYVYTFVGDFDGDRLDDLAVWVDRADPGHAWLLRQLPDGGFAEVFMAGSRPVLATDLDGDGDDELMLISAEGALWTLGAGDEPPPRYGPSPDEAVAPPDHLRTATAREAWADAEVLRELGLVHAAATTLLRAADHTLAGDADLLAVRAGRLAEAAGDLPLALQAFQRGLASADMEALTGLHRVARATVDLDAAWDAASRLRASDPSWQAELDRLTALRAEPVARWRADGSGLPDLTWQLPRPAAVHRPPDGLDVALLGGQGTVLSLPLSGAGHRVGVRTRFRLAELDPGVELELDVVGPFGLLVGVLLGRDGRTGAVSARCRAAGIEESTVFPARDLPGELFEVEVQRLPEGVACRLIAEGEVVTLQARSKPIDLTPTAFVIRDPGSGDYGLPMSTLARLLLLQVEVYGASVAPAPAEAEAWRVVTGGLPETCGRPDGCVVAALRHGGDLRRAIDTLLREPDGVQTLRLLLRVGTPSEVERLRLAMGPEAFATHITGAWSGTLHHAPPQQVLAHLDQPWLDTVRPDLEPRVLLLGRVAEALNDSGRHARAAELLRRLTAPEPLRLIQAMVRLDLLLSLARAELALDHPEAAREALQRALLATPAPDVVARRVASEPGLARLLTP